MRPTVSRFLALPALLAAAAAAAAPAEPAAPVWAFTARSAQHGEALTLRALGAEDPALDQLRPRHGRNIAYVDDELRWSRSADGWTWTLLARNRAVLVTDDSTLDLVRQIGRDTPPATDRRWRTRLRYDAFQGGGLEARHDFTPAPAWRVAVAGQLLTLRHWRRRTLDGPVQFDAASGTYAFDLRSVQADDRLRFPFQGPRGDSGTGWLLAAEAAWREGPWAASVGVRDLGWLRWNRLPRQDATLSTQTRSYDADGFVVYQPLVEGRNSQRNATRALRGWWTARASWEAPQAGAFELSSEWAPEFGALPAVAWRRRVGPADLALHWRFHERRAGIAVGWRGWTLQLGVDRLGSQQRSREVALGAAWSF